MTATGAKGRLEGVLGSLNAVPGVTGSAVCDLRGGVLAQAFPASIDPAHVAQAAVLLADGAEGLELTKGTADHVDFRFGEARLVVKPAAGALLLVLCGKATNFQFLAIAISVAAAKLAGTGAEAAAPAAPDPGAAASAPVAPAAKRRVAPPAKGLDELQRRLASAAGRRAPEKS